MTATAIRARSPLLRNGRALHLARAAVDWVSRTALAVLVVFHAWLLWTHVADGRVFDPSTAVRWGVAVLVLCGFQALRRVGLPVLWGRGAVVLWLLVLLIHCHAAWTGSASDLPLAIPAAVTELVQLTTPVVLAGTLLLVFILFLGAAALGCRARWSAPPWIAGVPASGYVFSCSPRAPPA